MNNAEPLCNLRFIKAEYRCGVPTEEATEAFFDISIGPRSDGKDTFSVAEKNGDQFTAELDALAALIRARAIRARVDGEEAK